MTLTHIRNRLITLAAIILSNWIAAPDIHGQNLQDIFSDYLNTYERADARINPKSKVKNLDVNDSTQVIKLTCEGGFEEQFFTEDAVRKIYADFRRLLPDQYKHYQLVIITDKHPIEELVPNAMRSGHKDTARLWKKVSKATPWVRNNSRPYQIEEGLDGTHISVWQSHGKYYEKKKDTWEWQRPRLFCTCEDIWSQTFVIPYIIPMLENAGAVVFTPRERDWQRNEVIIDNDAPHRGGTYIEGDVELKGTHSWQTTRQPGFARTKAVYTAVDHPFESGTARQIPTVNNPRNATYARWVPTIPEDGRYAVYVSYQTLPTSVEDAHYTVYHKGGKTEFSVNQQMGGSTWVYLGTFAFDRGQHDYGMVVLTNESRHTGIITADAVRFGGGMGNIARGPATDSGGTTSGLPRWAEASRYTAQWYGMPDSVYDAYEGEHDYNSDIQSRPRTTNQLAGGSAYEPNQEGRKVPFEMSVAFHTDAGFSKTDELIGSLSICSTDFYDGVTDAGVDRYTSRDLASMVLANLHRDLKKYGWQVRKLWNRNYGETRVPQVPGVIVEMLSHQNFADMKMGYDPYFKFDFCRSIYKTIVKYAASMHQRPYTIQPLPVENFAVTLNEKESQAVLTWDGVDDPLEPSARPTHYIVYKREGNGDFDNGTVIHGTSCTVKLPKDRIYSFRICALNKGGRSFPSETLSACLSSRNEGTVLIVNGFTRLSGPASVNTATTQGFRLDTDPGVPYGAFAGFCGEQIVFTKSTMGSVLKSGLGYSGSELEGKVVMGNTFDYAYLHGMGVQLSGNHSFASASASAFIRAQQSTHPHHQSLQAARYKLIDVIYGVQTQFDSRMADILNRYCQNGGRLFLSGANMGKGKALPSNLIKATLQTTITDKQVTDLHGSGLEFSIYRQLNEKSYAVPQPEALNPQPVAFPMLVYSNGMAAAVAYDGHDYKSIAFGFPLESITDSQKRNRLMSAIISFLCKD